MPPTNLSALVPLLLVMLTPVAALLAIAARRHHEATAGITVAGLALALASVPPAMGTGPGQVTPLLRIDDYALLFTGLVVAAGIVVAMLAHGYWRRRPEQAEEFYVLLGLATAGAAVLAAADHFAALFLGVELLSVSLFGLCAYPVRRTTALEAGLKYLILSGVASGLLLFGIALVYADSGQLGFATIGRAGPIMGLGLALILAGLAFKLSWVPFHLWTPDVYQGAPSPATAFLATVSKGAVLVVLVRWLIESGLYDAPAVVVPLAVLAVLSMLAGNLLALLQEDLKRILAYSSVAHLGYILVAVLAGRGLGAEALAFYLVAYFVTTLGAFAIVALLSEAPDDERHHLDRYRGLLWQQPGLAFCLMLMLLSLAGLPVTAGFVGKFYLFAAGVDAGAWILVAALLLGSAIGLFYYLRVVAVMVLPQGDRAAGGRLPLTSLIVLAALTALLVWLGVYPTPTVEAALAAAAALG